MKQKRIDFIPLIVMLAAGLITSVFTIIYRYELVEGLIALAIALIVFYIIGQIVKSIIFNKVIKPMELAKDKSKESEADNTDEDSDGDVTVSGSEAKAK